MISLLERFERKYIPEPNSGCWLWLGGIGSGGYGCIYLNKRQTLAHRTSYEIFVSDVPSGFFVCHACDNKLCVNPEHLFVGTHADNMLDMTKKGRGSVGERRPRSVLTPAIVRLILSSSLPNTRLAAEFGVTHQTIWDIRHRRVWRHVEV